MVCNAGGLAVGGTLRFTTAWEEAYRMTRTLVAVAFAIALAGCGGSSSQTNMETENPVDVCADKGIGPTHAGYEACLEDTARGRCSQAGSPESSEYGDCMKGQSDAAFARDQVRRWGY